MIRLSRHSFGSWSTGFMSIMKKMRDSMFYRFEVYTDDADKAREIVEECARIMCDQSYDHGASWRTIKVELYDVHEFKGVPTCFIYTVGFRKRDAG